ncbi:spore germination protein [Paenibacillus alvei]|uniref:Spore germination protein n=1 Tax=Paenibacillus alvei TaxID=44250 RepID=A0ABT4GXR3_PAEAL|nr:spore germination protein [Paenibacillus alvei]MCY7485037.1 spore germination protein [Paenibacillus alvei]MCY9542001.1 spore germination protein [Paenibacillus alvei]MCY9706785.1 spore germination protein [Paenibacillus alvei]MCY9735215.1 spore germination protein [Paenibacillus alvei]MCY9755279.1 spore germination protein [Paenibacillus alvei]
MWQAITPYIPSWQAFAQAAIAGIVPYILSKIMSVTMKAESDQSQQKPESAYEGFIGNFDEDLDMLKADLGQLEDLNVRMFQLGYTTQRAALVFVGGISDRDFIDTHLLESLMGKLQPPSQGGAVASPDYKYTKEYLVEHTLPVGSMKENRIVNDCTYDILKGDTALFIEGHLGAIMFNTRKVKVRGVDEPPSEVLVRGPRLGFNECLVDNMTLLRQQGGNKKLTFIHRRVGKRVQREMVLAYIEDIAEKQLVTEVLDRISKIDIDDLPDSSYIEQLIEDNYLSPFPQLQSTERLDRTLCALLEGRVAIFLEGSPFASIAPATFTMLLQSPEDYYERWIAGTLVRCLRYFAAFVSTFGPSLYISLISFHQGLIPTKLALSIAGTRVGVPFPSIIEVLIMEVSLEILREAGLRLPKPIGQTVGIVGGLVIGDAAVRAGIVSPFMVIVVAVTAISSFAIPQYSAGISLRILRFLAIFAASILGLYGVVLFFLLLCSHLVKLKSFGVPYMSPAVPYRLSDWKDFILRAPLRLMKKRPKMLGTRNPTRED